jgi:hypothetical protein
MGRSAMHYHVTCILHACSHLLTASCHAHWSGIVGVVVALATRSFPLLVHIACPPGTRNQIIGGFMGSCA